MLFPKVNYLGCSHLHPCLTRLCIYCNLMHITQHCMPPAPFYLLHCLFTTAIHSFVAVTPNLAGWEEVQSRLVSRHLCVVCYLHDFQFVAGPETEPKIFVGRTPGQIIQPRGQTTFGWDPVFLPDGYDQTYAELDKAVKNKISHRYAIVLTLFLYLVLLRTCAL